MMPKSDLPPPKPSKTSATNPKFIPPNMTMLNLKSLLSALPAVLLSFVQVVGISEGARSTSNEDFACPTLPSPSPAAARIRIQAVGDPPVSPTKPSLAPGSPEQILPPIPRLAYQRKPQNQERPPKQLVQILRSMRSTPEVCTAVYELSVIGKPATPVILPLLKESDPRIRSVALQTLLRVKGLDRSIISDLRPLLSDASPAIRARTLNLLSYLILAQASNAQVEIKRTLKPWLMPLLQDENPDVRLQAGIALILATDLAKLEIPTLIALLKTPGNSLMFGPSYGSHPRMMVITELGDRGETAKAAIPALVQLLEDSHRPGQYVEDKFKIVRAILEIGGTTATTSLVSLLNNSDKEVRLAAVANIACSPENDMKSQPIVSALLLRLNDPNLLIKTRAIEALRCIQDPSTFPALIALLKDDDDLVEQEVRAVLWEIHSNPRSAEVFSRSGTPELLKLLRESKASVRIRAIQNLGYMTASAHLVIPALIPLLNDPNTQVQSSAAEALKNLGYQP
jgi:HEAT repeat protein